ncbi:DUF4167 domain-containing protein [Nitratireductor luteus]|uniref:DUF4167 domain-containing protein n=1 Tax=Nitratireductor luteus TaxID=2976980 RepID=UPI00223F16C6|nr:DUF4167 domain-containing protein [Nitratireductor luteus]
MRGRGNNNNRKGPNPLTRSYESNGPDVKIRGTAQQVAEKYTTLARDAHSSGDRVMAENYLQHAEHYNRIIAAAQAQAQQQSTRDPRDDNDRDMRDDNDDDNDDRNDRFADNMPEQPRQRSGDGSGPQPVIEGTPAEVALKDRESSRGNGARSDGRSRNKPNGASEDETAAKADNAGAPVSEDGEEAAPKPAKRTRRPRAKKPDEAGSEDAAAKKDASEASVNEEVAAQG